MTRKKATTVKFFSKDCKLTLTCEWGDCLVTCDNTKDFTRHVTGHIDDVIAVGGQSDVTGGVLQEDISYMCLWNDCMHHIEGGRLEFKRHVYFHTFHSKLKSLGMAFIAKGQLNACMQGANNRNIIPDLPERFQCGWSNCEIICDNPEFFYSHVKSHSEDYPAGKKIDVPCKCLWQGCEVTFKQRYSLQDHLRSHTQEKVIACPTCGGLFSNMSKFKDHLLRQDENLRTYQCSHCSKCYQNERLLRDHMRKHVSNYKCPFCEMTVAAPSQLKQHIKYRHTDDRHFVCKVCNKGFKTERCVERHERSKHSNLYHYCQYEGCTFKCKHQFQLNSHVRFEHKNEDPQYACHICSCVYTRGRTLTVHLMRHHGFRWMPGHRKFKYNLNEDGIYRLQTVRYESFELSQQMREEGLRKTLNNDSEAATSKKNGRSKSNISGHDGNHSGTGSSQEGECQGRPMEGAAESNPLDLSSPTSSTGEQEMKAIEKLKIARRNSRKNGKNNLSPEVPNSPDMTSGISPEVTWTFVGEETERRKPAATRRGMARKSSKCKARKSLEDAINTLRNSPQKSQCQFGENSESDSKAATRPRKRKEPWHPQIAPPKKKKARRSRVRTESTESDTRYELASDNEDTSQLPENPEPDSEPIPNNSEDNNVQFLHISDGQIIFANGSGENVTDYVPSQHDRQQIEQLRVKSTTIGNSSPAPENTCRLVTVGGQVILVETNVASETFVPSNELPNDGRYGNDINLGNSGYGELPEGATIIARGETLHVE